MFAVNILKVERGTRIELVLLAWKARAQPLYQPRINTVMHIYDAITATGLHIHLSMQEDESFYILVHDLDNFTLMMKFFSRVEPALDFIKSL